MSNERNRMMDPNDPVNRYLPAGEEPVHNPYGASRQIADASGKLSEQLQSLEGEKISLMKRLNMVLAELEKATHEKSDVALKLREQERHAEELRQKLGEVQSLKSVVNKNLQGDLNYERDLNSKLRDELTRFEQEKDSLLVKLKEEEQLGAEIAAETQSVNNNLHHKVDDLKRLELEHDSNSRRLRELNDQLEVLRSQEINTRQQKLHLEEQMADLSGQRNDLVRRISELQQKYDSYVHRMNVERNDLARGNKLTVRMLVAKLMVQILDENVRLKRKNAFQEIFATSKIAWKLQNRLSKFVKIVNNYNDDRSRHFIRVWYRNAFNTMYENRKRTHIIDSNVAEARCRKFFYNWRTAFLMRKNAFGSTMEATKIIARLATQIGERSLRQYICKWRDAVLLRQAQQSFLHMISERNERNRLQRGFVMWLAYCKKQSLLDRYDCLSDIVSTTWFKQRVFLALKHACHVQRAETSMFKFTAWKNWCQTNRENKYFEKKQLLVERQQGLRTERLLKQVFDAIKYFNVQSKFEATRDELLLKIPEKENLEYRRDCLINNAAQRTKLHNFRQFYLRHCDLQYRALQIWKENCVHYRHTMNRFKMQLTHWHNIRLQNCFMTWKEATDKEVHAELLQITRDNLNENQNLTNEKLRREQIQAGQETRIQAHRVAKLDHISNMLSRHNMKRCFYKWIEGAVKISNMDAALMKLQKVETRGRKRVALFKFRDQAKADKREEFVENRSIQMILARAEVTKKDCWRGWIDHLQKVYLARRFLKRALNGMARNARSDAFFKWKAAIANENHTMFGENIRHLQERQREQERAIEITQQDIQNDKNNKQHLLYQMKNLSYKIMANFVERSINMQTARGFYTWRDNVKEFNIKRRTCKKIMLHVMKRDLAMGFRTWALSTHQYHIDMLTARLAEQEHLRKTAVAEGKQAREAQQAEQRQLEQTLLDTTNLRDMLKRNFDLAFNTHKDRTARNIYVEKRRHIFISWKDFVKREKNAVNVIGAIARRTLRVEVFQRIARMAREKYLDIKAENTLKAFHNLFLRSCLRKAMSRWRENTYKQTVQKMKVTHQNFEMTVANNDRHMQMIHAKKEDRAHRVLNRQRLRRAFTGFKEMTKILKEVKVNNETAALNIKFMKAKRAIQKMFLRTQVTMYMRRRNAQVLAEWRRYRLQTLLNAWKKINYEENRAQHVLTKIVKRMQFLDQHAAFLHWAHYTISAREREKESREHGTCSMVSIIKKMFDRRKALALHQLKLRAFKKDYKHKFLARVFKHASSYRLRHYFMKWEQFTKCEGIAETVNTEGDVVLLRNDQMRQAKAMRDALVRSGYSPEEIEEYLNQKAATQKNNMQKGIIGLFFQNSEFQIMPKAFNQWKNWINARKNAQQKAQFVLNLMRHPCARLFYRWKYENVDAQKRLKHLTKQQLIDKIIADENLIGATEARLSRMDDAIDHLAVQRETLLGHYMRGQKLAVALMRNNYLKTMMRAFMRWKRANQEFETRELMEQLDRTNQMISELGSHVGRLGDINRNLLHENEELRQTALDGIEIAKVVQELTKERESLSQDLVDRAGTIKRLIEDNNNLSVRLGMLQREGQELDHLNQQSCQGGPPMRDMRN